MIVRFVVLTCAAWGLMPSVAWAQNTAALPPPEAAASAAATAAAQAPRAARRAPLVWKLDIEAPGALDDLLSNYLDLARYHKEATAEGDDTGMAIRRSELRRLVAAAPDQARSLLEAQGYFAAQIHTRVSDEVEGQPLLIKLVVEPGPRTRVSRVQMVFEGELDTALSKDEAHAKALVADLESEWALPAGTIFTQPNWSAAKNGMLARMRAEGYPLATWSGTSATVDAQNRTAALFVVADSGPIFHPNGTIFWGCVEAMNTLLLPSERSKSAKNWAHGSIWYISCHSRKNVPNWPEGPFFTGMSRNFGGV